MTIGSDDITANARIQQVVDVCMEQEKPNKYSHKNKTKQKNANLRRWIQAWQAPREDHARAPEQDDCLCWQEAHCGRHHELCKCTNWLQNQVN